MNKLIIYCDDVFIINENFINGNDKQKEESGTVLYSTEKYLLTQIDICAIL